jgi:hypothetical protein
MARSRVGSSLHRRSSTTASERHVPAQLFSPRSLGGPEVNAERRSGVSSRVRPTPPTGADHRPSARRRRTVAGDVASRIGAGGPPNDHDTPVDLDAGWNETSRTVEVGTRAAVGSRHVLDRRDHRVSPSPSTSLAAHPTARRAPTQRQRDPVSEDYASRRWPRSLQWPPRSRRPRRERDDEGREWGACSPRHPSSVASVAPRGCGSCRPAIRYALRGQQECGASGRPPSGAPSWMSSSPSAPRRTSPRSSAR